MVSFLNSWISGVVVAVVVGSIIEMILPESNNKKYVKTIIGIFILFTIISPAIVRFSGGIDLKSIIDYQEYANTVPVSSNAVVKDNSVLNVYKSNISKEISKTLEDNGYKVLDLKLEVSDKESSYGEILSLKIVVKEKSVGIETIDINVSKKPDKEYIISNTEKDKIKECLNSIYGVSKENIEIN